MDLLSWWNLIFVLPFGAALFFLLLQAFGALQFDDGHDVSHDGGHHDVHDIGHHDLSVFEKALSLIGVGRVPLSLLLTSFALLWGFFGWASNQLLQPLLTSPTLFVLPSLCIALFSSGLLTRGLALGMSRLMPATETYATSKRQLLGKEGTSVSQVSSTFGRVRVKDEYGNLQEVSARVSANEPAIADGVPVVLMSYDDEAGCYLVGTGISRELDPAEERMRVAAASRQRETN